MRYIKSTFSTNVLEESLGPANIATTEAYLDCFKNEGAKNSNKILIWKYLIFFYTYLTLCNLLYIYAYKLNKHS